MKKLIVLLLISIGLAGCGILNIHKLNVEQGNIFSTEQVNQLRLGMSSQQVKQIMGNPVMVNIFATNQFDYIYTDKKGNQKTFTIKRLIITFKHDRVINISH
jgi:outer membrane protein assembly factor BamE